MVSEPRAACAEPLPAKVLEGIEQFNRREFFECHESIEEAWLAERRPVRRLYQGILQVGVAFYHLQRQNWAGATRLLESGLGNLAAFRPSCQGVDVASLYEAAERARAELLHLGPERLDRFDHQLIPTVRLIHDERA